MVLSALLAATEPEQPNPLIPHTGELIIGFIAFGVLAWVLIKTVFPAIERTYAERRDLIEGGMTRAEQAQAEAQATLDAYREQLADARSEAARIVEKSREQGQQIVDELSGQARERAAAIVAAAQRDIEADRQRAVTELRGDIGRLAVDLAGRIVGDALQDADAQRRVIDGFLDDLEAPQGRVQESAEPPQPVA